MSEQLHLSAEEQRFVNALEASLLSAAEAAKTPYDELPAHKKGFVEASKAFSMIAGAGATGLNMFGVSIAYMSKRAFPANENSPSACAPSPSPSSKSSETDGDARYWLLVVTFFCFLYTCCTAAVAHAIVHRPGMFKLLTWMIHFEIFLLSFVCGLYYYMLTETDSIVGSIWFPAFGCVGMWVAVTFLFRDPALPGGCFGDDAGVLPVGGGGA